MDHKNPTKSDALKKLNDILSHVKSEPKPKKSESTEETAETKYNGVQIVDNVENGSFQIFFHDFPTPPVRAYLKHHGFQWSPIDQCWSCPRSPQAMFHAEKAIDKMRKSK